MDLRLPKNVSTEGLRSGTDIMPWRAGRCMDDNRLLIQKSRWAVVRIFSYGPVSDSRVCFHAAVGVMTVRARREPHVNLLGSALKSTTGLSQNVSPIMEPDGSVKLMIKGPDNNTEASILTAPHWKGPCAFVKVTQLQQHSAWRAPVLQLLK